MSRNFVFEHSWVVDAAPVHVQQVLVDLEHYPEWWPQVLAVARIDDDHARVLCRSALPYTLDLVLTAVHRESDLLESGLSGDLSGWVRWRLSANGGGTRLDFTQQVEVTGRPLGLAAYAFRGPLRWNHDRMMTGGLAGLRVRLAGVG